MKRYLAASFCIFVGLISTQVSSAQNLQEEFANPPEWTRPWYLWYWLDGKVAQEGITKDLENLKRLGASRILLYNNIYRAEKGDPVKLEASRRNELTRFSLREAKRLGLDVYIFNSPGWSQSGGPWIAPEQSMRRVTWKEFDAEGGAFSRKVRPEHDYPVQDIAVLAIPRPELVSIRKPSTVGEIEFTHKGPFVARSLSFLPDADNYKFAGTLFAIKPGGERIPVRTITEKVQGKNAYTSFLPLAAETFSFEDIEAQSFVLEVTSTKGVASIEVSSQPKVEQVIEKQLGRMHPTPLPAWESYQFADTAEPDPGAVIRPENILNFTMNLSDDGVLDCTLPEGKWTIIIFASLL